MFSLPFPPFNHAVSQLLCFTIHFLISFLPSLKPCTLVSCYALCMQELVLPALVRLKGCTMAMVQRDPSSEVLTMQQRKGSPQNSLTTHGCSWDQSLRKVSLALSKLLWPFPVLRLASSIAAAYSFVLLSLLVSTSKTFMVSTSPSSATFSSNFP